MGECEAITLISPLFGMLEPSFSSSALRSTSIEGESDVQEGAAGGEPESPTESISNYDEFGFRTDLEGVLLLPFLGPWEPCNFSHFCRWLDNI